MKKCRYKWSVLIGMLLTAAWADASVTAPFLEPFDSDPLTNASYVSWKSNVDIELTHNETNGTLDVATTTSGYFVVKPEVSNLGGSAQKDFIASATVDSSGTSYNQIAVFTLGDTIYNNSGYVAVLRPADEMRIVKDNIGGPNTKVAEPWTGSRYGIFTIKLIGEYQPSGDLVLTMTATDSNGHEQTITWTATEDLEVGHYFGVGGYISSSGLLEFDEFSVLDPVTAPFSETFVSDPSANPGYVSWQSKDGLTLTHDAANGELDVTTTESAYFALKTEVLNLGGSVQEDFSVSATVTNSGTSYNQIILFTLSDTIYNNSGYVAVLRPADEMRIVKDNVGGPNTKVAEPWTGARYGVFTLELTGRYQSSGDLVLTMTVTDANDYEQSITWTATEDLEIGRLFGIGGYVLSSGQLDFDGFDVMIPNPDPPVLSFTASAGIATVSVSNFANSPLVTNILQATTNLMSGVWTNLYVAAGVTETNWALPIDDGQAFFRIQTTY